MAKEKVTSLLLSEHFETLRVYHITYFPGIRSYTRYAHQPVEKNLYLIRSLIKTEKYKHLPLRMGPTAFINSVNIGFGNFCGKSLLLISAKTQ